MDWVPPLEYLQKPFFLNDRLQALSTDAASRLPRRVPIAEVVKQVRSGTKHPVVEMSPEQYRYAPYELYDSLKKYYARNKTRYRMRVMIYNNRVFVANVRYIHVADIDAEVERLLRQ